MWNKVLDYLWLPGLNSTRWPKTEEDREDGAPQIFYPATGQVLKIRQVHNKKCYWAPSLDLQDINPKESKRERRCPQELQEYKCKVDVDQLQSDL